MSIANVSSGLDSDMEKAKNADRHSDTVISVRAVRTRGLSISVNLPVRERIHHVTFAWYTLT
jgi:hypothetical protein